MAYYNEKIVKSKLRCRKCKSINLRLVEVWTDHTIVWHQVNGQFDRNDGNLDMGNPAWVEAHCDCGHTWKPKNCNQIDYVVKEDSHE